MKLLAVCGAGMGTSVIMKIKLNEFLKNNNIDGQVESCSLDEGKGNLAGNDIVICSKHLAEELKPVPEGTELISVENVMAIDSYGPKILEIMNK